MSKNLKKQDRIEQILDVSIKLFIENGYEKTSLSHIVKLSGGSLSTIYDNFGNKLGLFSAIIERWANNFSTQICTKIKNVKTIAFEEFLTKFGEIYLDCILKEKYLAFRKIIAKELLNQNSEIAKTLIETGIKPIINILVNFFSKTEIKSKISESNLELLAFRFCFLLEEPIVFYKEIICKYEQNDFIFDKQKWIENCVNFFLNGANKIDKY